MSIDEEANKIANGVAGRSCAICHKDIFEEENPQWSFVKDAAVCLDCWRKENPEAYDLTQHPEKIEPFLDDLGIEEK